MRIPTPLTPSVDYEVTCNISIDEYFDTVYVDDKALFGNKYNKVITISVAMCLNHHRHLNEGVGIVQFFTSVNI